MSGGRVNPVVILGHHDVKFRLQVHDDVGELLDGHMRIINVHLRFTVLGHHFFRQFPRNSVRRVDDGGYQVAVGLHFGDLAAQFKVGRFLTGDLGQLLAGNRMALVTLKGEESLATRRGIPVGQPEPFLRHPGLVVTCSQCNEASQQNCTRMSCSHDKPPCTAGSSKT